MRHLRRFIVFVVLTTISIGESFGQFQPKTGFPDGGVAQGSISGTHSYAPGNGYGGNASGSPESCTGTVTYKWTWTGSGPAPASAVVTAYCQAGFGGGGTGTADDGLGDSGPGVQARTKYFVEPVTSEGGVATVKYTINPSVSGNGGYCWVTTTASVTPVTVAPSGLDSAGDCLVGQYLVSTASAGAFKLKNYSWSLPGTAYASVTWTGATPVLPTNSAYQPDSHTYVKVSQSSLTNASVTFFEAQPLSNAPVGLSVDVWDPTNSYKIGTASPSYPVTVMQPTNGLNLACPGTSIVQGNVLWSGAFPPVGMSLTCWVDTQSEFSGQGTGYYCFVQLWLGTRSLTLNGVSTPIENEPSNVLDVQYPYGFTDINNSLSVAANTTSTDPSPSNDTPNQGLTGGQPPVNATAASIDETYSSFLIYQAPSNGNGEEMVPVYEWPWTWNCSASLSNGSWTVSGNPTPGSGSQNPSADDFHWTKRGTS